MKLNFFKFQDGKVFWLPEYPEKNYDTWKTSRHNKLIVQSLESAIEVAQEDTLHIEKLIWFQFPDDQNNPSTWQPENSKVYSVECEMEVRQKCQHDGIHNSTCIYRQVARLKPKEEIFPAANSHDMKDEDL